MRGVRLAVLAAAVTTWGLDGLAQAPSGAASAGARIDRATFHYQRRIPAGAPGVASLRLDLGALAHSRLADLRLVSADGFQVPYLLEDDPEPLRVNLPPLVVVSERELARSPRRPGGPNRTVYAVSLPFPSMPPCHLVIETPARVFERELSLIARNDSPRSRNQGRWTTESWGTWRHTDPDRAAPPLILQVPPLESTDVRLVLDEGDNQPLPLGQPALETRTWQLRFVRESGAALWLAYGRRDLEAPQYDLALLRGRLKDAAANEVTAEPEQEPGEDAVPRRSTPLFWAVLVLAVLGLVALVVRLLRLQPDQTS
jgi:hypothetical protein